MTFGFPILSVFSEKGIKRNSEELDNLTSSYYSEKERIEIYPKDWCRVS